MPTKRPTSRTIRAAFESLLAELTTEIEKHYGARLISAVVFGSVGRGTPRADSDLDILIIADPLPDGRMPRVADFAPVREALAARILALRAKDIFTTLAPIFKTPADARRGSLLFLDMIDDGRILSDRSGFWNQFLGDFKERLRRLGARKIVDGDRWYWDLKPDYRVGEIFEI